MRCDRRSTLASEAAVQGRLLDLARRTSVSYDMRNHPKNPTSGLLLAGAGRVRRVSAATCSTSRRQPKGATTIRVTEKITFVGRAIGGHIEGWGGQDVRLLDLFFKGGETIRGFNVAGYGPRDMLTGDALGGDTFWSATAEVRFPLPLIPDDLGMSGAVFADAGSLFGAQAPELKRLGELTARRSVLVDISSSDPHRRSGASILWNSPLGPLRIDIAKAMTKKIYDKEQFIRFGASTRF